MSQRCLTRALSAHGHVRSAGLDVLQNHSIHFCFQPNVECSHERDITAPLPSLPNDCLLLCHPGLRAAAVCTHGKWIRDGIPIQLSRHLAHGSKTQRYRLIVDGLHHALQCLGRDGFMEETGFVRRKIQARQTYA